MLDISEFEKRTNDLTALVRKLVEIESPTSEKAAVDRLGDWLTEELSKLGADVTIDRQRVVGNHLIARWPGEAKPLLMLCHMDTVFPTGTLERFPCRESDGKLFGPGAVDMKAGIAILLAAIAAIQEIGGGIRRSIVALFTSDEETGSLTSRDLIEQLSKETEAVFCLEPSLPDGSLKTFRKGVGHFEILARGRSAHAGGAHAEGVNAIEELAHQVIAVQKLTDPSRGTTLNVGVIHGGTATNVVPSEATAQVDFRVSQIEEAERVKNAMLALKPILAGAQVEIQGGLNRPPMVRDARMQSAFRKAQQIASRIGITLTEGGSGGGSDANFVAATGQTVLDGLGGRGDGLHSDREYVEISSLPLRAALLSAFIFEW